VGGCTGIGDDGGGGGGRIVIYYGFDEGFSGFDTSTAASGFDGHGQPGEAGTIVTVNCAGDCNADRRVTIDELIRIVDLALGDTASPVASPATSGTTARSPSTKSSAPSTTHSELAQPIRTRESPVRGGTAVMISDD
jgi:hypothetical protein